LSEQVTEEKVAVKIKEDSCSRCTICISLCPFDALKKDVENDKTILEIEKCQVCGLCYSACPSHVVDIMYYDLESLTRYLQKAKKQYASDTLVIMCKGSAPDLAGIEKLFGVTKFIPLTVPCVGRIPEDVFLKAITMGIKKIYVLACDEDYCRYDSGSPVEGRRIMALNLMLSQLGYGKEAIVLKHNSLKVQVNQDLCIGCGNCVFYCPWEAPSLVTPGAVKVDLDKCHGCGLCVSMCPAFALDLDNWEQDRISLLISQLAAEMASPKVLVFCCQWAVFPTLDEKTKNNIRYIYLPCAARVDTAHIVEAFGKGVDGVLIAACTVDDCKLEGAGGKVQRPIAALQERLGQVGYRDRLSFCTVSPRYPEAFAKELAQFSKQIANIGKEESA
jgi:coenzyme F420-reducing hydrogenase delta subunit/formate hydrogenlyase subunit 6/NADH:ubiquinone oxidoreductase subunit I